MMVSPKIDERSAEDLIVQLRTMLRFYVPELPVREGADPQVEALIQIFARFGMLTIDRMNRAPMKNMLAFLNLAGISPLPPRAARVPLTFYLGAQNLGSAVVPARTQVAAELAKGETKPVLYETESELVVVAARLESLLLKNVGRDQYRDWTSVIGPATPPVPGQRPVLQGPAATLPSQQTLSEWQAIPHRIFVALPPRTLWPASNALSFRFEVDTTGVETRMLRSVQWELCTPISLPAAQAGDAGSLAVKARETISMTALTPESDDTEGLARSGTVVFRNVRQPRPFLRNGCVGVWLSCRLLTPLTNDPSGPADMVQAQQIPMIKNVVVITEYENKGLPVNYIVANGALVDATKDFFPFGERPKFGDTMYLGSEGFADPQATVTVLLEMTNPSDSEASPIAPTARQEATVSWEYWDGKQWVTLGIGNTKPVETRRVRFARNKAEDSTPSDFTDTTQAFTGSGFVSFSFTSAPMQSELVGKQAYWIRARLIGGAYGAEAAYTEDPQTGQYRLTPASFAAPSIRKVSIDVKVKAEAAPLAVQTFNDFITRPVAAGEAFCPFVAAESVDQAVELYLGFLTPAMPAMSAPDVESEDDVSRQAFPARSMSLYVGLGHGVKIPQNTDDPAAAELSESWEYWNGAAWTKWTVRDGTQGLTRTGILKLLAPLDYQLRPEFGLSRYWLRMRKGRDDFDPEISVALLNTTLAREGATLRSEVLGASSGRGGQILHTAQSPVLEGQQLEVREPGPPTRKEARLLLDEEGDDAIREATSREGLPGQVWVRWHAMPNLDGSGPRDRHYMLDALGGEVHFGDGINGMIPQVLPGNIRMASYRTGGGERGNKGVLTITQMKSAVPYIDKVVNWVEATGGGDPESMEALLARGPRLLRHGNRAVTAEDFEDLALLSSSQVARAKCVPLRDLEVQGSAPRQEPGVVSLIVVPVSIETAPMPSGELLENIRTLLMDKCMPTVRLVVVGPVYRAVEVDAEVAVKDPDQASKVELAAGMATRSFLHPVTGGRTGAGWEFGRKPHRSDLLRVIEDTEGVSHVRGLKIDVSDEQGLGEEAGLWLTCPGKINITTTLED